MIDKDILLLTDGHAAYRAFAREAGISRQTVNLRAGIRVQGAMHVQNVHAYHSRLRDWLRLFHGVASRYLPNYLGWRWILDAGRIRSPETLLKVEGNTGGIPTSDGDIAFFSAPLAPWQRRRRCQSWLQYDFMQPPRAMRCAVCSDRH